MANKLMFEAALDGSGFSRGVRDMQILAGQAGQRINAALSGGGHGVSTTGAITESLVLLREANRGNYTRMAGSVTLLAQRLGLMNLAVKENVASSELLALSLEQETAKAALAAAAAAQKAQAANAVFMADEKATAAQLEAAASAEIEAVAARNSAIALNAKAVAARDVATAEAALNGEAAVSITKFGVIGIVIIAAAAAAYFLWGHFKKLEEQFNRTGESLEKGFGDRLKANEDAMVKAADSAADFNEWLRKLGASQDDLASSTEQSLQAMREQFQLMRELAALSKEEKGQELSAEQSERKKELALVSENLAKQKQIVEDSKAVAAKANANAFTSPEAVNRQAKLEDIPAERANAKTDIEKLTKLQAELQEKVSDEIKNALGQTFNYKTGQMETRGTPQEQDDYRKYASSKNFSVGEKGKEEQRNLDDVNSLLEKTRAADESLASEKIKLAGIQRELSDIARDSKEKGTKDNAAVEKLTAERDRLTADIALHDQFDHKIAAADALKKAQASAVGIPGSDSLVRVGNFLGSAKGQIETLAQEANKIARAHHETSKKIEHNTRRHAKTPGAVHYSVH